MASNERIAPSQVMVLLGLLNVTSAFGFGRMAYPLVLPSMQSAMGLLYSQAGVLAIAITAGYTLAGLSVGALVPAIGTRWSLCLGMLLCSLGLFAAGLATRFEVALGALSVMGVGAGFAVSIATALPRLWTSPANRGIATGIVTAGGGLGMLVAGSLLPLLLGLFGPTGWRWVWFSLAGFSGTVLVATLVLAHERPSAEAGAPLTAWREVLGSTVMWLLVGIHGLFNFAFGAYATFLTSYFQRVLGWSASATGGLWVAVGVFSIAGAVFWGLLSDRLGRRLALRLCLGVLLLSCLTTPLSTVAFLPVLSVLLFAMVQSGVPSIIMTACGDYLGAKLAAGAVGMAVFGSGVGNTLGPLASGLALDRAVPFYAVFLMSAVAVAGALLLAGLLRPPAAPLAVSVASIAKGVCL